MTRYTSNDVPVTDEELGRPVTPYERMDAIRQQAEAFDRGDLMDLLYEHGDDILRHIASGDTGYAGDIIADARKATIARRASYELFGTVDVISPSEVTC
jgi:hypothetical protein